ncbi:MAG: rhomboid family intramembrane serine protease [Hyphomicrobiales bacterium]|nr:rhomboid family intramembrane serine protease [Hyphomicrobiales bacterium]
MSVPETKSTSPRQSALNLPGVVVALLAAFVGVHVVREYLLGQAAQIEVLFLFSFIPVRVLDPEYFGPHVAATGAVIWSFVTYAFLHADWSHLIFNGLWLAAFGSAVAFRFGAVRFLAFSAAGAIGGVLLYLAVYPSSPVPLVGASAAVSAHMAGAARFAFSGRSPFIGFQGAPAAPYRYPAPPLAVAMRDRRVLTFLGIWFGFNLLFGLFGGGSLTSGAIAWEAHIGGFAAGLLLFSALDPVRSHGTN